MKRLPSKEIIGSIIVILLFVASAFFSAHYDDVLRSYVEGYGMLGMVSYVGITILSTVLAPLNTVFLLPVAVALWGPLAAALLSLLGWVVGAVIAFTLAQAFGHPLVMKLSGAKRIDDYAQLIPQKNLFVWIVLLRMAIPVDVLSYALGLFLPIHLSTYALATLIGTAPFAFIFAYASYASGIYIAVAGLLALAATFSGIYWFRRARKRLEENNAHRHTRSR